MTAPTLLPGSREWCNYHHITPPATRQAELLDELAAAGLATADAVRAVTMWNILMRGILYKGGHRTAVAILAGGLKHHKIPEVPEWRREWLAPLDSAPVWKARAWTTPDACDWDGITAGPRALASYDVNGMFLSAAGGDLGSGPPELGTREDSGAVKLPGWLLVEAMDPIPAWLGGRWRDEPMWMPTPLVELLIDSGVLPLWSASLLWPTHRRWLAPHVGLFRDARARLILCAGDPAARALRDVVKDVYTRAFGGELRRKHKTSNDGDLAVNHGWGMMIPAIAQARMLRAVTKIHPARLLGIYHDAAWFNAPEKRDAPLELSTQLGKWKVAGRLPWTDELAELYGGGHVKLIARRLKGVADDDDLDEAE